MIRVEEIYRAQLGDQAPLPAEGAEGAAAAAATPFTIEVRFLGGLTKAQKDAFKAAANRWTKVITGDLPSIKVEGELVDDVLILAQGVNIDGPGRVLGQAGPTHLRPANIQAGALLPARGIMSFDTADLATMEQRGTLGDVITHEMGHVLGIGTLWAMKGLIGASGTDNPVFTGASARQAYGALKGGPAQDVPVENEGGEGTAEGHWREILFRNELMSGFISAPGNPLSRVTVASLRDLGYQVDLTAADNFVLPNLLALAEAGALEQTDGIDMHGVIPVIPIVLAAEAMAAGQ
jgi:hypothetical protein